MAVGDGTSRPLKVLLINAPFGLIEYPHLGISLIKAVTEQAGFQCDILYATIEFARLVGFAHYRALESAASPLLLPERIFATALSPNVPSLDAYFEGCVRHFKSTASVFFGDVGGGNLNRDNIRRIEKLATAYCEEVAARPELGRYDVIGFSSSFGQHTAALAIAKRIKQHHPHVVVCVGGANAEGAMGKQLVRSFPFVDYAFSGDGDMAFPIFLRQLAAGKTVDVPGVFSRADTTGIDQEIAPLTREDMDGLPYPDFTDFFAAYDRAPEGKSFMRAIPIEASRGCWWGEKHHCTFCGLNGLTMKHRSKSPERFVAELEYLVGRYGQKRVMATDNILDMKYLRSVIPMLRERHPHDVLFWEVKSNLDRDDLQALSEAGVTEIQPGIESLSSHVLQLIDKGVTAIQNVQLLKWAEEIGITVVWTTLTGVPGETPEDYVAMAELMQKIPHLQPSRGFNRVSIDRFAPYFKWPERYGITIHPALAYRYVYDLPEDQIQNLAFWFYYDCANGSSRLSMEAPPYAKRAVQLRAIWESVYGRVRCCYDLTPEGLVEIEDTRPVAAAEHTTLDAAQTAVFLAADGVTTVEHVARELAAVGCPLEAERIAAVLADLEARKLVHREGTRWLALPNRRTGKASNPQVAGGVNKSYLWRQIEKHVERRTP